MERVLVVDDEPQVLLALEDLLSEKFVVLKAGSGEQALSLIQADSEVAVVVTDQRMPRMSGDELLARLEGRTTATRLLLTGYADVEAVTRAVNQGRIFAYVTKPWSSSDLLTKVQRAAEHFQLARELEIERRLLQDLMESIPDGIYFKDAELRFLRANPAFLARLGRSAADVVGKRLSELVAAEDAHEVERAERELLGGGKPVLDMVRAESSNGRMLWLSESKAPVRGPNDAVAGLVTISRDITLRKDDEVRLARLTSVRTLISGINAAVVRTLDRDELLSKSCRIAATAGELALAVVARVSAESASVELVASEPPGHPTVEKLKMHLVGGRHDSPLLRSFMAAPGPVIINDISSDERLRYKSLMLEHGLKSAAVLPMMSQGRIDSVFCLFSTRPNFFDREEVRLLLEVTDNISYALEHIGKTERLDFLAYHDELTRLPNRELLLERLEQQIAAARGDAHRFALLVLDVDRFRHVNDTLGREAGDALLLHVAERLCSVVGDRGTAARVFGNTFAVLLRPLDSESLVASFVENELLSALQRGVSIKDVEVSVSARVGIAVFPSDASDAAALLSNGEAAVKKAKASGQPYVFYAPSMNARVAERVQLETKLRRAQQRDEFLLYYQPKVDLRTGRVLGLEALIRWRDPNGALVPPGVFIPLLEETGLIRDVGRWVIAQAARQHDDWSKAGKEPPRIAVNVSAMQLSAPDFLTSLDGIPGSAIELEITESVFVEDLEGSTAKLREARKRGFTIAMDDFGTGYSSLSALESLPLDSLKVDQSFVRRMLDSAQCTSIVTTIISLGHALDMKVVAEGVETWEQARLLRLVKCDQAQGYLFAKPVPAEQVPEHLNMQHDLGGAKPDR